MTELAFHFGAADPLAYTCRLLRKAVATGARVLVRSDAATVSVLDSGLWELGQTDFVAHCDLAASAHVRQNSPVLLAGDQPVAVVDGYNVLVNLAPDVPDNIDAFERVIEIVGNQESDRQAARARWKHYVAKGMAIQQHNLTERASG